MPLFRLSSSRGPKVNWMEKQTRKAVLLHLVDENGNQDAYWFPKSQCTLSSCDEGFEVDIVWRAWNNRKPAVGMGCL